MRWEQKISNTMRNLKPGVRVLVSEVETYETIYPFRKFRQSYKEGYWQLPKGIDNLVNTMEKARLEKNWEVADTIRKKLTEIGIVVRNGKDWYPKLFEKEIKIVMMVRDLPSIMASWLNLLKSNPGNHIDQLIISNGFQVTDETRVMEMWNNMVKDCYESVTQAVKDAGNRILIIEYDDLMKNPKSTLASIESFLELSEHEYDFNNIINNTNDDDLSAWGLYGIHTIKNTLKKTSESPQTILGNDLFEKFKDIERSYRGQYGW
jgi:hypothetical protein